MLAGFLECQLLADFMLCGLVFSTGHTNMKVFFPFFVLHPFEVQAFLQLGCVIDMSAWALLDSLEFGPHTVHPFDSYELVCLMYSF